MRHAVIGSIVMLLATLGGSACAVGETDPQDSFVSQRGLEVDVFEQSEEVVRLAVSDHIAAGQIVLIADSNMIHRRIEVGDEFFELEVLPGVIQARTQSDHWTIEVAGDTYRASNGVTQLEGQLGENPEADLEAVAVKVQEAFAGNAAYELGARVLHEPEVQALVAEAEWAQNTVGRGNGDLTFRCGTWDHISGGISCGGCGTAGFSCLGGPLACAAGLALGIAECVDCAYYLDGCFGGY